MAHIMDQLSEAVAEAHNYKKGYERLKEENKKLKEKGYLSRRVTKTIYVHYDEENKKLEEEHKKIKEELQKFKEDIDDHFIHGDLLRMKEWDSLQEENKKLKEEVKDLKLDKEREYDGRCADNDENEAREKKLEEENKTLKEERDFFHQEFHKTLQSQADDMEEYEKQIKTLKEEVEWNKITIQKEVRRSKKMVELKEENKKLKEHLAKKFYNHYDEMDYDKMFIAKTVGPNLDNMVEHMMKQNKELSRDNEYLHMKCETMEKENHKSEEEMMEYKDEKRSGEEYDERMCRAEVVKRVEIKMVGSGDHHYWYYLYEDGSLWRVERYPFKRKTYLNNKVLVCDREGDPDNVKLVDSDYELKEDEMPVEYDLIADN